MLLFRWIAPVRNSPAGTTTRPPPALLHASMALANASVQSALPFAAAPNLIIGKSRAGKTGALMRARICEACDQGSTAATTAQLAGSPARTITLLDKLDSAIPAPLVITLFMKSRRLVMLNFPVRAILTAEGAEGFAKVRRGKILRVLGENLSVLCG